MIDVETHLKGFEKLLLIHEGLAASSVGRYKEKIREFFSFLREKKPEATCETVERKDVEEYLEWCFYRGNANHTRLTKLIALGKFFRYLVYEGLVEKDVTALIPRPKIWKKFMHKFSKSEILQMFEQIDIMTEKGIRDATILILAVFCGLRSGEIIRLTVGDVIDDGKWIDLNIIDTKHHSNRIVDLWKGPSLIVRQWLMIRIAQGAKNSERFLMTYYKGDKLRGQGIHHCSIDNMIKMYAARAKIRKQQIHMHMFRATHASDLRMVKGYDIPAIAKRLGHRSIMTTDGYLPVRGRIHKEYRSLAEYWSEFNTIWDKKYGGGDGNGREGIKLRGA